MEIMSRWWRGLIDRLAGVLSALLALLLCIFLAIMWSEAIEKYVAGLLGLNNKSDLLKFNGFAMGGLLVALQALASHRRALAMEESAAAQARATREQAQANLNSERGQRQQRLKNAIEHLGYESDSVRLGGAYELFHLAHDTVDLRQTVLDILCVHIRRTTGEATYRQRHASAPSEEVQSLLSLLFVLEHDVFQGLFINLQGSWLNGADLVEARLEKARFVGACLQGVELRGAHLEGAMLAETCMQKAVLLGAWLQQAVLSAADLREVDLRSAHLEGATLQRVNLQEANLNGANLQGTDLFGANLQGAWLRGTTQQNVRFNSAQLQGVDLSGMRLQDAVFYGAHLEGAILRGAYLQKADLEGAHLQGAELAEAYLPEAKLREASLQGADMEGAHLQGAELHRARMQGATLCKVNMQGADLTGAQMQAADLREALLQGANLFGTHLQGADLSGACLHGVRNEPELHLDARAMGDILFRDRLRNRIDRVGELSGGTFEGGLTGEAVDSLTEGLPECEARRLRETLEPHLERPPRSRPPEDSGALVGAYTGAEAERWITEYQRVMSPLPW